MKSEILSNGLKIISALNTGRCYIVGGYVRNIVMGKGGDEMDIVIDNISVAKEFADKFKCNYFTLGGNLHRVVKGRFRWDFTELAGDIKDDLKKRDFKCDAMAVEISNRDKLIDPLNGEKDIKNKLLSPVTEEIFSDDAVRIIRAFRLRAELDFRFSERLQKLLKKSGSFLKEEKGERIRTELEKIFLSSIPIVVEMAESGIFKDIFSKVRSEDVIKGILNRLDHKTENYFLVLTATIWQSVKIAQRLKFSRNQRNLLSEFFSSDKDIFNCWLKWGILTESIFEVRYIITGDSKFLKILNDNKQRLKNLDKPVISGKIVMNILNLKESPDVGVILKKILRKQFEGSIKNAREAGQYIRKEKA